MKAKKPLAVRIFIRICVVAMVVSWVWVYVAYMFTPSTQTWGVEWTTSIENVNENEWESTEIMPEINPENPEETNAPILLTEDWEIDEMDQTVNVQLENWQTETVRLWDLNDAVQIN